MLDHFGFPITPTIATNLYVALLTDTGGFRHENTTPQALEDAARLARLGADPGHIATLVYKMRPETTLKLNGLALATMRVEMEGRLAWAKVTRGMLREAGAVMAESEGIIDTLNSIAGLELAILFKEVNADLTKISVRSRGGVDAAALCAIVRRRRPHPRRRGGDREADGRGSEARAGDRQGVDHCRLAERADAAAFSTGVLNVDKGAGETSFAVVSRLRRLTGAHRVGHAGTLDPLATGVLPILFESATRLAEFALRLPKTYVADIHLGFSTATDDAEAEREAGRRPERLDRA